jgi:DNA-binding transcriptional LysR family regulator
MDHIETMRMFVAVARTGSFAEAARRSRLSPSVATRAVAQLENRLGVALFSRTTRSVRLTELGAGHLDQCARIIEALDDAERQLRGDPGALRGEMVVAAPVVFGRLHVLPIIAALLRQHAALAVRLILSDRNAHVAEEGIDVAVRIGPLADSSLMALRLGSMGHVLVASPQYLAGRPAPEQLADLQHHGLIVFEGLGQTNEWRFRDETIRIRPRLSVTTADCAIAAAETGLGITRTLAYQVEDAVRAGRLVPLLTRFAPPPVPVSALYQRSRRTTATVAAFIAEARTYFAARMASRPE